MYVIKNLDISYCSKKFQKKNLKKKENNNSEKRRKKTGKTIGSSVGNGGP